MRCGCHCTGTPVLNDAQRHCVSLHLPLIPELDHVFGKENIIKMKKVRSHDNR